MKDTMGIIFTGGKNSRLKELSASRATAAIPVGGKYRAIDFVLSNMVNSEISNIGVLTQYSFRSLMDHLGSGKEWDLDRRKKGLFIFPPYLNDDGTGWYKGSADAIYSNLTFLRRSGEEFVLIAGGNCVYKMRYDKIQEFHTAKNSDITIVYREMNDLLPEELSLVGHLQLDEEGRITDFREKPPNPTDLLGSMGIYFIRKDLLVELLEESAAHGEYDFVRDIIIKKLNVLNIHGYKFDGYWRNLGTIQMYYRCNMELLDPHVRYRLFLDGGRIYTKVKDEPPAKYNEEAVVRNSIIADGCIIEGTVEDSVLFRGVTVKKGAYVKDCIIMQGSEIGESVSLRYVICDKNVSFSAGRFMQGDPSWPVIVGKGINV